MVEMFGLKVSADAWESLDRLGTKHTDDKTGATKVSRAPAKERSGQPPQQAQQNGAAENGEKPKKMSNLLRRLATKLADKGD